MQTVPLDLVLTPHGSLVLVQQPDAPSLDAALARRLRGSFDRRPGHGLLRLGAAEAGAALPPVYSYWREFGARYVTDLCTQPDVEARRDRLRVPRPRDEELEWVAVGARPMIGADYLTVAVLGALWQELDLAFGVELAESQCGVQEFLKRRNPAWNLVGRVHFNVAENRKDPEAPFAFLATYTTRLSAQAKAQRLPLGQALREYAGAANKDRLLSLASPRAASEHGIARHSRTLSRTRVQISGCSRKAMRRRTTSRRRKLPNGWSQGTRNHFAVLTYRLLGEDEESGVDVSDAFLEATALKSLCRARWQNVRWAPSCVSLNENAATSASL